MSPLIHLTHCVGRLKAPTGGERAVLQLTKELARMGVASTIVTRGYSDQCDNLLDSSVDLRVLDSPLAWTSDNHLLDSFLDTWLSPALLSLIPDETDGLIFHAEATPFALWWAKKLLRTTRTCVYFCYQPPQFAYYLMESTIAGYSHLGLSRLIPMYAPIHRWFDRGWVRPSDAVWTFSKAYAEWCSQLYDRPDVVAIPPGVDLDRFISGDSRFLHQEWAIPEDTVILLTVNKLIPRKNIDVFIQVVRWLRDYGCVVKGVIAGDGAIRHQLESFSEQVGVADDVIFAGHVADDDLPHYYASADAYLFLEQNVPFGMTPLEAAASGTPSIAPRGGGTTETIVHGETGFLVDSSLSIPEIGKCVLSIVQDEQVKREMRRRVRGHAREFTWQRFAQEVYDSFTKLRTGAGHRD